MTTLYEKAREARERYEFIKRVVIHDSNDDDEDLEEDEEGNLYKQFPVKKLWIVSPTTNPYEPTSNSLTSSL